jgi:hypothetical protein
MTTQTAESIALELEEKVEVFKLPTRLESAAAAMLRSQAAEIDALRTENKAQLSELEAISSSLGTREGHSSVVHIEAMKAEYDLLAKNIRDDDNLRVDAERYRAIRKATITEDDAFLDELDNHEAPKTEAEFDAIFDAARAAFWEKIVPTNLDLENLSENLCAHKDYTRAVIAERDEALKECEEQARLLGMSGSREAALLSERDQLRKELAELLGAHPPHRQCMCDDCKPSFEAEPVQEPVGEVRAKSDAYGGTFVLWKQLPIAGMLLYASPQDGLRKAAQMALELLDNLDPYDDFQALYSLKKDIDMDSLSAELRKELGQ